MTHAEAIAHLRAAGYLVLSPDDGRALMDDLQAAVLEEAAQMLADAESDDDLDRVGRGLGRFVGRLLALRGVV